MFRCDAFFTFIHLQLIVSCVIGNTADANVHGT